MMYRVMVKIQGRCSRRIGIRINVEGNAVVCPTVRVALLALRVEVFRIVRRVEAIHWHGSRSLIGMNEESIFLLRGMIGFSLVIRVVGVTVGKAEEPPHAARSGQW